MPRRTFPRTRVRPAHLAAALGLAFTAACAVDAGDDEAVGEVSSAHRKDPGRKMLEPFRNAAGKVQSATATGRLDVTNPFFQSLGSNGRSCATCHLADQGWSITPEGLRERFQRSGGDDVIFQHDGLNAPGLPRGTFAEKRAASSLLLSRGLIRLGLAVPTTPDTDFELVAVEHPSWGTVPTAPEGPIFVYRRPLPTTNLRFIAAINWDGRSTDPVITRDEGGNITNIDIRQGLLNQSNGATVGHAQFAPNPPGIPLETREQIVALETSLTTAQIEADCVGRLDARKARGGPAELLRVPFTIGQTRPDGRAFTIFDAWKKSRDREEARIADGQRVFNEKSCAGCHDAAEAGSGARFAFFDVGVSDANRRRPDVPLYTFRNKETGATVRTTDPGRALFSRRFADIGKFKSPVLRGLASRAPYFHDGSARTLREVVDHYERRLSIRFTGKEKESLVAFLEAL